jgi:glycosyltransferase involved in cell wall biosynthesis
MTDDYSSPEFRVRFAEQARRAASRSDFIITVSQFTAAQVRDLLGFPGERIRVIPHGISMSPSDGGAGTQREKLVLFVGAIQRRKNVGALIEAFSAMPADWRLVLAGAPSGYGAEEILQGLEASPARSRIVVSGYVPKDELARLYRRASIFAFPSLAEGFGMPVLDAMAYGVPVLTSNSSALREVAGDAAVLVDPHFTDDIAQGLQRLAKDDSLRSDLIRRGLARAEAFSWKRSCEATYAVYCDALR